MSNLNVANLPAQLFIQAYLGYADWTAQQGVNYQLPTTQNGAVLNRTTYPIPANTTNNTVNLASLFPAVSNCVVIGVFDQTSPGQDFKITTVSGSGKIDIAPSGIYLFTPNGGSPPTLYIDNPSTSIVSELGIFLISL